MMLFLLGVELFLSVLTDTIQEASEYVGWWVINDCEIFSC